MGSDRLTPGDVILDEIIAQGMVTIERDNDDPVIFVWNGNTADQLDATVRNHIHSCSHPVEHHKIIGVVYRWCGQCGAVQRLFSKDWDKPKIV